MNSKKVEPKKIVVEEDDLKALSETVSLDHCIYVKKVF